MAASAAKVTANLKGKGPQGKDEATFGVSLTVGDFDTSRMSVRLVNVHSEDEAARVRREAKAEDGFIVVSVRLLPKPGVGAVHLGELSGMMKLVVSAVGKELFIHKFDTQLVRNDSGNMLVLNFMIDPQQNEKLKEMLEVIDPIVPPDLLVEAEFSESLANYSSEAPKIRVSGKAGFDRNMARMLVEAMKVDEGEQPPFVMAFSALLALRNISFNLALEDVCSVFKTHAICIVKKEQDEDLEKNIQKIFSFAGGRTLFAAPFYKHVVKKDHPGLSPYLAIAKYIGGVHSIQAVVANNVVTVPCSGVTLGDFLPGLAEIEKLATKE